MVKIWRDNDASNLALKQDDAAILADGQRFRVPTLMRDAVCSTCDGTGRWTEARLRCPDCGGKNLGNDRQLTDVETQMRDHLARDQDYRRTHAGNMAGYRYAADSEERRASRQQLHDAYAEYEATLVSSWKDLEPLTQSPDIAWSTGAGSPSKNFGKPAPDGSVCTLSDGRPGHIVNGECVADSSNDSSRSLQDMMRDHQLRMAEETRIYENSVANAYKNLR